MRLATVGERMLHHYVGSILKSRYLKSNESQLDRGVFIFVLLTVVFFVRGIVS